MCSYNPEDCPMYECTKFSQECIHCKWLKRQRQIARISQIGLFLASIAYIMLTTHLW